MVAYQHETFDEVDAYVSGCLLLARDHLQNELGMGAHLCRQAFEPMLYYIHRTVMGGPVPKKHERILSVNAIIWEKLKGHVDVEILNGLSQINDGILCNDIHYQEQKGAQKYEKWNPDWGIEELIEKIEYIFDKQFGRPPSLEKLDENKLNEVMREINENFHSQINQINLLKNPVDRAFANFEAVWDSWSKAHQASTGDNIEHPMEIIENDIRQDPDLDFQLAQINLYAASVGDEILECLTGVGASGSMMYWEEYDRAKELLERCLKLSRKLGLQEIEIEALEFLGHWHERYNEDRKKGFEIKLILLKERLDICRRIEDKKGVADCCFKLFSYHIMGDLDLQGVGGSSLVRNYLEEAIENYEAVGDFEGLLRCRWQGFAYFDEVRVTYQEQWKMYSELIEDCIAHNVPSVEHHCRRSLIECALREGELSVAKAQLKKLEKWLKQNEGEAIFGGPHLALLKQRIGDLSKEKWRR